MLDKINQEEFATTRQGLEKYIEDFIISVSRLTRDKKVNTVLNMQLGEIIERSNYVIDKLEKLELLEG